MKSSFKDTPQHKWNKIHFFYYDKYYVPLEANQSDHFSSYALILCWQQIVVIFLYYIPIGKCACDNLCCAVVNLWIKKKKSIGLFLLFSFLFVRYSNITQYLANRYRFHSNRPTCSEWIFSKMMGFKKIYMSWYHYFIRFLTLLW